ncbi:MAG: histidine phosphatase family protein [Clostridia bacterium]|nr:histidine phosphatase family protein [Clostridia bacterium]
MTTLLLVRHGESAANQMNVFAGHTDADLSALGHEQAEKTAEYLAENYKIDAIYSSDLKRAFKTGLHTAVKVGVPMIPEQGLREINAGRWENRKFDDLQTEFKEDYNVWLTDIGNAVCTGGESVKELGERIQAKLTEIAKKHDGGTVLVTTHATPIRVSQCIWEGKPLSEMKNIPWVSNASVTIATYDGKWCLKQVSIDAHLAGIRTVPAANV